jgi:SAM-dependent methyltransferase
MHPKTKNTSWEKVSPWYDALVKGKGHYYHEHVIFPNLLRLLETSNSLAKSLLDLGCGPGVVARHLPASWDYWGIDLSFSMIQSAKNTQFPPKTSFIIADATKPLPFAKKDFDLVTLLLSLQNMEFAEQAIENSFLHLKPEGKLVIVLNHPLFRIPKKSSWEANRQEGVQYRKLDGYLLFSDIPMQTSPSKGDKSPIVYSFHRPLSYYSQILEKNKFLIQRIEEWISDKTSEGGCREMEDQARKEFPLFLAIVAVKKISS